MRAAKYDRRPRRRWLVVPLLLTGLWLLYLVVGNALLWSHALEKAAAPEVVVDHDFAWTIWPAVIHTDRFAITLHDAGVELEARWSGDVEVDVDIDRLLAGTFQIEALAADEATIAIDGLMPDQETPIVPILAPAAARVVARAVEPAGEDEVVDDDRWAFELDTVELTISELRIDEHRLTGRNRLRGDLSLHPGQRLAIDAVLVVEDGTLQAGGRTTADELQGTLSAVVERDLGASEWRRITGSMDLAGTMPALEVLAPLTAGMPLEIVEGRATFDVVAQLTEEGLAPDARVKLDVPEVVATTARSTWRGSAHGTLTPDGNATLLRFDVDAAIRAGNAEPAELRGGRIALRLDGGFAGATVKAPLHVPDLGIANQLFALTPADALRFEGGKADAKLDLTLARDFAAKLDARLDTKAARFAVGGMTLSGDVHARLAGKSDHLLRAPFKAPEASVAFERLAFGPEDEWTTDPWSGTLALRDVIVDAGDRAIAFDARGEIDSARSILDIPQVKKALPRLVERWIEDRPLALHVSVASEDRGTTIDLHDASTPSLEASGKLQVGGGRAPEGTIQVDAGLVSARIRFDDEGSEVDVGPALPFFE